MCQAEMGITLASARFLVQSKASGTRFGRVLTLGRQHMAVTPARLKAILDDTGVTLQQSDASNFDSRLRATKWRFEEFLKLLDADEVLACDASDYEGATIIHDLNIPVPKEFYERFDTVIDGGTLEHVFNFPEAIKSVMQMVKVGGRLFIFTPANNYFGHGFYQFSAELFYRVLSEENGYRVERMIGLVDDGGFSQICGKPYFFRLTSPWYAVQDPRLIRKRVTLLSELPVMLFIEARRISAAPIFSRQLHQSDYSEKWIDSDSRSDTIADREYLGRAWDAFLAERLPTWVRWRLLPRVLSLADPLRLRRWKRYNSFYNRDFFRKINDLIGR